MPEPSDQLTITLSIAEWNQFLQIIGGGPYNIVAPLVGKMNAQASAQLGPSNSATSPLGNGVVDSERSSIPMPQPSG